MKRIFLFLLLATVARGATYDYPVKTATNALSASKALTTDANGKAAASATTSTEIGYVSGVTSAIQTQLNAKGAATNGTFSGGTFTGATNVGGYYTNSVIYGGTNNATTLAGTTTTGVGFSGNGIFSGYVSGGSASPISPGLINAEDSAWGNGNSMLTLTMNSTNRVRFNTKYNGYGGFHIDSALGSRYPQLQVGSSLSYHAFDFTAIVANAPLSGFYNDSRHLVMVTKGTTLWDGGATNAGQIYAGAQLANGLELTAAHASAPIKFMCYGTTERMRLTSVGLGIGTTTPQYIGDFNGQVRILGTNGVRFGGTPNATDDTVRISQSSANVLALTATTTTVSGGLTIAGTTILTQSSPPANASAAGTVGTIAWDADYIYICTAANTWKRVAISTW